MNFDATFMIKAQGEREIVITRPFDARRQQVFDALTKPELLKRWLLGPPGWSMPVCEVDLRAGGTYRYQWRSNNDNSTMDISGQFREVNAPIRFVAIEKFGQPPLTGQAQEAQVTYFLDEKEGRTTVKMTLRYLSQEARDRILDSDMGEEIDASYEWLAELLAEQNLD